MPSRKLFAVLLVGSLAPACEPEIAGCPDPNQPTTYATFFTPPCPPIDQVVGWAEIDGVYHDGDLDPISGQTVRIRCPGTGSDERRVPFADASVRTRRDGRFRTTLALRIPEDEANVEIPASAFVQECVFSSGAFAEARDTVQFTSELSGAQPFAIELVWGEGVPSRSAVRASVPREVDIDR